MFLKSLISCLTSSAFPSSGPTQTKAMSFLFFVIFIAAFANISGPFVGFNLPKNKIRYFSLILYFFLNWLFFILRKNMLSVPLFITIILFLFLEYLFKIVNSQGVIATTLSIIL